MPFLEFSPLHGGHEESVMQVPEVVDSIGRGWRFKFGIAIFLLACALWLLVPVVALTQATAGTIPALTSTLFIGNKALLLLVVARPITATRYAAVRSGTRIDGPR
jgi:hypothetical protein